MPLPLTISCMANEAVVRSLSVEEWYDLSQTGIDVSVRIPVNGISMLPLIRRNRDRVTILPRRRAPKKGDVVMFRDPGRALNVLHRVWKTEADRVLTWGDNCRVPDGWIPMENVKGIAVLVERGNRRIRLDTDAARRWGSGLGALRHVYCRGRHRLYKAAKRLPAPLKNAVKTLLGKPSHKSEEKP